MSTEVQEQVEVEVDVLDQLVDQFSIILYNDDVNTFDHVIDLLVKYCKHEVIQAEQCAYIVHYNGKCMVQGGVYEELEPVCTALLDGGLSAKIE